MNIGGVLAELKSERDRIDHAITVLENISGNHNTGNNRRRGRRRMSAAARARISKAQKARWAAQKARSGGKSKSAAPRKRRGMSAAARKRMSAMMKARWAARKKAAPAKA